MENTGEKGRERILSVRFVVYGLLGVGAMLLLILLCAVLMEREILPLSFGTTANVFCVFAGGLFAGGLVSFREKNKLLLLGGITAAGYSLLLLLIGAIFFSDTWLSGSIALCIIPAICGCLVGVLIPWKKQKRKMRRR